MKKISSLALLLGMLLAACGSIPSNFYYSKGGVVRVVASAQEVDSARQELLKITPSSTIQSGMVGGALFDGVIRSVASDGEGNKTVTIKIENIIFGLPSPSPDVLEIVTPPLEYGGIDFHEKKRYRVYAVKLEGRYQTWSLTGTAELP